MTYTGDVTVDQCWKALSAEEGVVLIDVRTQPEWAFVWICDLSSLGKTPLLISWQNFPDMSVNMSFVEMVSQNIEEQGLDRQSPLYFLCRSGVRSKAAASAMVAAGFANCFNILGGFEGDLDEAQHRGTRGGWKAAGLPWFQK